MSMEHNKIHCSKEKMRLMDNLMKKPDNFDEKYDSLKKSQILMEPITPEKFINDHYFLGKGAENLWPRNKEIFCEIAEDKRIEVIVLTGSIGWGKGFVASCLYSWYLYEFLRYRTPQALCGLATSSPMYATITSVSATHAKKSFFKEIRGMLKASPFFKDKRPFDNRVKSEIIFKSDNHGDVAILPSAPDALSDIGLNLFLCLIDEWAFMEKITDSKRAEPGKKVYDQAQRLFENLRRRIRNRTTINGEIMGKILLVSSANYEGDIVDQFAKTRADDPTIKIIDETEINTKPGVKNAPSFYCFIGDISKKIPPKIIETEEESKEYSQEMIEKVPESYRTDFEDNPYAAIRDILGIRTSISSHLFPDKTIVDNIFKGRQDVWPPLSKLENIPQLVNKIMPFLDLKFNYAIHYDLAKNKCLAGMALSRVSGLIEENEMKEFNDDLANRAMISVDYLLSIDKDDFIGEVSIPATEELVFELINRGVNITSISWDGFQSQGSRQRFESIIKHCDILSIDSNKDVYYNLLRVANQGRISSVFHKTAQVEIKNLLDLPGSKKITKGSYGSKDLSDALSSSVYQICKHIEDFTHQFYGEVDFYEAGKYNSNMGGNNSNDVYGTRITNEKPW